MMDDKQIEHMVSRFLAWKLPDNFNPDGGISFKREFNENTPWPMKHEPSGTNLLDAIQAEAMVRHMLDGLPVEIQREASGYALKTDAMDFYPEAVRNPSEGLNEWGKEARVEIQREAVTDAARMLLDNLWNSVVSGQRSQEENRAFFAKAFPGVTALETALEAATLSRPSPGVVEVPLNPIAARDCRIASLVAALEWIADCAKADGNDDIEREARAALSALSPSGEEKP